MESSVYRNTTISEHRIKKRINKYYENHDPKDAEQAAREITATITNFVFRVMERKEFDALYEEVYAKVLKETKKRLLSALLKKEKM